MGIPWQDALGSVLISGILFLILALSGVREKIINAIPQGLKYAVGAGIGLFIAFIGLKNAGIIVDNPATLVSIANFAKADGSVLIALFGLLVTVLLMVRKIHGAVFYGIVITSVIGMIFGLIDLPDKIIDTPPALTGFGEAFGVFTDASVWTKNFIIATFIFLIVDLFDNAGTLVAVATQAGLMKDNKLPRAGRALTADSVASISGAVVGTSTVTSYIESSAGVAVGGKTGFTALVTAGFFGLALFFSPLLSVITAAVTAPALIIVGVLMTFALGKIAWEQIDEAVPAFLTILMMPLSFSIATGIAFGFISYPLLKLVKGEGKQVSWIMYVFSLLFVVYFIFHE
jgi:AGZA family xanthine/uracil permease-like MFS transporter